MLFLSILVIMKWYNTFFFLKLIMLSYVIEYKQINELPDFLYRHHKDNIAYSVNL